MRIVHVGRSFIEGYTYYFELLPIAMARLGHEVTVITPIVIHSPYYQMTDEDYRKTKPYHYQGVKVVRLELRWRGLGYRFSSWSRLYEHIEMESPEVLFCHQIQGTHVLPVCRYKRAHPECHVVADCHSDQYNSARNAWSRSILHKGVWRWMAKKVEKDLDRVYYITPNVRSFLKEMYGLGDAKLAPTYLGADLAETREIDRERVRAEIRRELGVSSGDFLVVTAGKIDRAKRTDLLLQAVKRLNSQSMHVVVVGSVEEQYRDELARHSDGSRNVHFAGWVTSRKVLEYFVASDLGVFPRSQSVLWQQAICCGLPCIFGHYPGGEYLNPAGNALYLYSEDPGELAQLIDLLNSDRGRLERMRDAALSKGVERFSYERIARDILEAAQQMTGGSP